MLQIINDFTGNILGAIGVFLFAKIILNTPTKVTKRRLIIDFILSIISYTIVMSSFIGTAKTMFMLLINYLFIKDIIFAFIMSSYKNYNTFQINFSNVRCNF